MNGKCVRSVMLIYLATSCNTNRLMMKNHERFCSQVKRREIGNGFFFSVYMVRSFTFISTASPKICWFRIQHSMEERLYVTIVSINTIITEITNELNTSFDLVYR